VTAHDRHLARYRSYPVRAVCTDCGHEWDDSYREEYGQGWLEAHEQCPECGSASIDTSELDDEDIAGGGGGARGEDF
jgi:predicted Zn-ribbon and HTH transcriptional regulator